MIVLHSILRHCWYSCETFMEIVELWSLEILITDTDFIIPFMSTDFIIPFMSTDFIIPFMSKLTFFCTLLPLVIIQLLPSYEVSIESCKILGGSFPEGVRSREKTSRALTSWFSPHIATITVLLYRNYSKMFRIWLFFCNRQQNNFWYRKCNYGTELEKTHRFAIRFQLSRVVDRATIYCLPLHY